MCPLLEDVKEILTEVIEEVKELDVDGILKGVTGELLGCDGLAKLIAAILRVRPYVCLFWPIFTHFTNQIVITLLKCVFGLLTSLLKADVLPLLKEIIELLGELLSLILEIVIPLVEGVLEVVVELISDLISIIFSLNLLDIIKCLKL